MLVVRVRDLAKPSLSRSINRFAARDFPPATVFPAGEEVRIPAVAGTLRP
jgi:hypothetical protein